MAETLTLYKLMILYMLDQVDFPMATAQIAEFLLDKGYTTYFKLQEALSELLDSGLIRTENTHNRTIYHLTENGAETISLLRNNLSNEIKGDIRNFLRERAYDMKEEVSVKADYYKTTSQEYEINCKITENGSDLLNLKLLVPTETEAKTIAANWSRKAQETYASLLSQLL